MAENRNDCKIFTAFVPSLQHLAVVKIASPISKEIYFEAIRQTDVRENPRVPGYREYILALPGHLMMSLVEALFGYPVALKSWEFDHSTILRLHGENRVNKIRWRSDGTVDSVGTVKELVEDESIDIGTRFELACMYFLEDSVQNLWTEMEATGRTNDFVPVQKSTANVWIRWMQDGSNVPWIQFIPLHLDPDERWQVRYSRFFPRLQPKDRAAFLPALLHSSRDDLRLCLTALTRREEEQMLRLDARRLYHLHLDWPLHPLFLDIFEKTAHSMDGELFRSLLGSISWLNDLWEDILYSELFFELWRTTPLRLRGAAQEDPESDGMIQSLFAGYRRVREMKRTRRLSWTCP